VPEHAALVNPIDAPYLPASQTAQTAVEVTSSDVAPATAYFPTGQVIGPLQVGDFNPVVDPNVPTGHNAHVDVFVIVEEIAPATA
jgi:hypothetical protein